MNTDEFLISALTCLFLAVGVSVPTIFAVSYVVNRRAP